MLENYYTKIYPLGQLMAVPDKEELPFFDEDKHDTMSEEERVEMYEAWAQYRENLRNASTEGTE